MKTDGLLEADYGEHDTTLVINISHIMSDVFCPLFRK